MTFTDEQVKKQEEFVQVLRYKFEKLSDELDEKEREHQTLRTLFKEEATMLNVMQNRKQPTKEHNV